MNLLEKKEAAQSWFRSLRDSICTEFEKIEAEYAAGETHPSFIKTPWEREDGGGGEISLLKGRVFEKVGVTISTVWGEFSEQFRKEIPGADADPRFWATGISLVAHLQSPRVPAVHLNTRMIVVGDGAHDDSMRSPQGEPAGGGAVAGAGRPLPSRRVWFGGGADLNPTAIAFEEDTQQFHRALTHACKGTDPGYYDKFKKWCDDYFWIKHRNEPRGAGGIFYDYLDTDWERHFAFTQAVGRAFEIAYPTIVRRRMHESWSEAEREAQLVKRGRYAEFNLLYDRGTRFGLMTGGNPEAILMSLPPLAKWP